MREAIEQFSRSNMPKYLLRVATQNPPPLHFYDNHFKIYSESHQTAIVANKELAIRSPRRAPIAYSLHTDARHKSGSYNYIIRVHLEPRPHVHRLWYINAFCTQ